MTRSPKGFRILSMRLSPLCTNWIILQVCFLLLCAPLRVSAQTSPRPNVVFILADDLGYAELGCYGQQKIRTPNIDALAAQGMRFTQFYAGSTVCAPSRCCLL